jgi:hypothetical protein
MVRRYLVGLGMLVSRVHRKGFAVSYLGIDFYGLQYALGAEVEVSETFCVVTLVHSLCSLILHLILSFPQGNHCHCPTRIVLILAPPHPE